MNNNHWLRAVISCAVLLVAVPIASAQQFPDKPIRIIGLYAPGSIVENVTRYIDQTLTDGGWPQIIYESRPGAYGTVGALSVKRAAPDGYTLLQADMTSHAVSASMVSPLPYDPVADFTPISLLWEFPSVLVLKKDFPANSLKELIAYAKSKPGGLTFGSQGSGSGGHLLGAMFQQATGLPMIHVPYRGPTPAIMDLLAGRVDFVFSSIGSVKGYVEAGTLKMIAISSKERLADYPDLPTMTELGYPSVYLNIWFGLMGPANMPAPIAKTLQEHFDAALHRPDVLAKIREQGWLPKSATPEEFRNLVKTEIVRLGEVLKRAGIVAEAK